MNSAQTINLKDDSLLRKKKRLNLALNILISVLGISSLVIFLHVNRLAAFSFFTFDGSLFTTVVSVLAVVVNLRELSEGRENESRRMFFLQLASAVTETVICIVVLAGYLPFFPDDPSITPYHMFCLHVAIPLLAMPRFIFFEKPCGILHPSKLLLSTIPIGVYGLGIVNAIKFGLLPQSLIPYSFLDFESNFLWYFVFALVVIPSFGFLLSWLFYRLNLRASLLWYRKEDVERLQAARKRALSHFDVVNSVILIVYCTLAVVVLMFSLRGMSGTATGVEHKLMSYVSFYMLDDCSNMVNNEAWQMRDGVLYKGEIAVGDGTEENARLIFFPKEEMIYESTIYVPASSLSPEIAAQYEGMDYVAVSHSSGKNGPVKLCGETLDSELVARVITADDLTFYEEIDRDGETYYHFCMAFGEDMWESGVGIIELYHPMESLTAQAKAAEYNNDLIIIAVIVTVFALLYVLTNKWIRVLEKSVDFLRAIASGRTPEEPIVLGKTVIFSGLERQLNVIREINKD